MKKKLFIISIIFISIIILSVLIFIFYSIFKFRKDDNVYEENDEIKNSNSSALRLVKAGKKIEIPEQYRNKFSWVDSDNYFGTNIINPKCSRQGLCWSCYAFVTADVINSALFMYYKKLYNISVQQIIDCTSSVGGLKVGRPSKGCNTGSMLNIISQYFNVPRIMADESIYPYQLENTKQHDYNFDTGDERCIKSIDNYLISDINYIKIDPLDLIQISSEDLLKSFIFQYGCCYGVFGGIRNPSFKRYPKEGGIIKTNIYNDLKKNGGSHAMLIVGWGNEDGIDYWLVKNTWGMKWGVNKDTGLEIGDDISGYNNGYIRMIANKGMFSNFYVTRLHKIYIPDSINILLSYNNLYYKIKDNKIRICFDLKFNCLRTNLSQKIKLNIKSQISDKLSDIVLDSPNNGKTEYKSLIINSSNVDKNNSYYFNKFIGDEYVRSDINNGYYFNNNNSDIKLYGISSGITSERKPTGIISILLIIEDTITNIISQKEIVIDMSKAVLKFFT